MQIVYVMLRYVMLNLNFANSKQLDDNPKGRSQKMFATMPFRLDENPFQDVSYSHVLLFFDILLLSLNSSIRKMKFITF